MLSPRCLPALSCRRAVEARAQRARRGVYRSLKRRLAATWQRPRRPIPGLPACPVDALHGARDSIDGVLAGASQGAWYRYYDGHAPHDCFERLDDHAPAKPLSSGTTVVGDGLLIPIGSSTRLHFMELYTTASARNGQESVAGFGNSLHFSWTAPEGVSFSSASGGFMSAVPEPGGLALLAAGLASVRGVTRRRSAPR